MVFTVYNCHPVGHRWIRGEIRSNQGLNHHKTYVEEDAGGAVHEPGVLGDVVLVVADLVADQPTQLPVALTRHPRGNGLNEGPFNRTVSAKFLQADWWSDTWVGMTQIWGVFRASG